MNYIKKLCILKQLSSGFAVDGKKVSALLTAESFSGRLTLTLALIGFAPLSGGRYRLLLCDEHGGRESFDIPSPAGMTVKKASNLNIADGFGCLVCFAGNKITPVAFGKCGDKTYDVKKMCASLDEEEAPKGAESAADAKGAAKPQAGGDSAGKAQNGGVPPEKGKPQALPQGETAPRGESPPPYDDEVVATENYFEFADVDKENLKIREDGNAGNSDEEGGKAAGGEEIFGEDEDAQSLFRFAGSENLREDEGACYYDKVKGELNDLFSTHPAEEELEKCVPLSRWARVTFARNKYYTVGVISDEKRAKYICYGVPAEKRGEPPEALKGKCSFLPLSLFEPDGKGYWMMFQDAETGQCVKVHEK